jgi:quinol monooxygenase YgiN
MVSASRTRLGHGSTGPRPRASELSKLRSFGAAVRRAGHACKSVVALESGMIIVSGIMTVDPSSHDRMVELARTVSTESLKEPGCRAYGLWADPDVRGRFRVFEEWDSQEALTEHFGTPHFAAFGSSLGDLELDNMDIHRYIDPEVADLF